ncbi:MAG: hypothetical protein GXO86_15040 [Chlorobi bacterium]|nr:hypothetical protein [Chlorobiota bacterium]
MKALEFRSKIKGNQILIPTAIQKELITNDEKKIRVIVLFEDPEVNDETLFREAAEKYFLKGYADSDSIYDND